MKARHSHCRTGFTLVEILITVAIVIALAALVIPVGSSMLRNSRKAACLSNLRQIGMALESYLQDHHNIMPELAAGRSSMQEDVPVLDNTLNAYLSSPDVFRCPEDKQEFKKSGSSYLWNSTQNGRPKMKLFFFGTNDSASIPLVTDKEAWHGEKNGANILYADYSASGEFKFRTSR
jgi:type II secretory pathway pseudopilin PulG